MLVSLFISTTLDLLSTRLKVYFPESTVYLFYVINIIIVLASISTLLPLFLEHCQMEK